MMMFWRELKVVLGWKRVGRGWGEGGERVGRGWGEGGERVGRGKNGKEETEENEEDFTGCAGR